MIQALLLYYIFTRKQFWTLLIGFILGIFLDIISLRQVGETSLFFTLFLFIIVVYERKFEINTIPFIFVFSFLGNLVYLFIFNYENIIWQAIISSLSTVLIFALITHFTKIPKSELLKSI